jgi:hypothetical protein
MFDIFMIFVRIKSLIIRFAHDEISETFVLKMYLLLELKLNLDKLYRPFGFGLLVPKHLSFIILLFGFRIF